MNTQFPAYSHLKNKLDYLQRRILISSVSSRQLNIDILDPKQKREMLQKLIDMQSIFPEPTQFRYGYVFKDFTIDDYPDLYLKLNDYDKEQIDKICGLYKNSAAHEMENYYILLEYITRGED